MSCWSRTTTTTTWTARASSSWASAARAGPALVHQSIGVHWGTFSLTDEAFDEPPRDPAQERLAAGIAEADFGMLAIGQARWLRAREARQSAP
jgi:hypothetical protein